jgi:hypothetical protein
VKGVIFLSAIDGYFFCFHVGKINCEFFSEKNYFKIFIILLLDLLICGKLFNCVNLCD